MFPAKPKAKGTGQRLLLGFLPYNFVLNVMRPINNRNPAPGPAPGYGIGRITDLGRTEKVHVNRHGKAFQQNKVGIPRSA